MKALLKNIAAVQTGVYAKPIIKGEVFYIQARHFDHNHQFNLNTTPDLGIDNKITKHFLQTGDVLIASKGNDHFAVLYKGIIKPAVASSMFIVIRLHKKNNLLPEFLVWFINQKQIQTLLHGSAKGTSIPSISISTLADLEIPIPSIEKQKSILKIYDLWQEEIKLKTKIESLKEKQIQNHLINALK